MKGAIAFGAKRGSMERVKKTITATNRKQLQSLEESGDSPRKKFDQVSK